MTNSQAQRARIEAGFEAFARLVVRWRYGVVAAAVLLVGGLASQLPELRIETAIEEFLQEDDPARVLYDRFRDQFGRTDLIAISVEPPEVFDLEFLRTLRDFHAEVEAVARIDEVTSLVNARSTYGLADELVVGDLLEDFPETPDDVAAIRERVLATPFYLNTLISRDASFAGMVVTADLYATDGDFDELAGFGDESEINITPELLTGPEMGEIVDAISAVMARYDAHDFRLSIAGSPILQEQVAKNMRRDMGRFLGLMIGGIALVLFALFRRLSGVFLPLVAVLTSVASTFGAMAATDTPLSTPTQILPTFLVAVGTGTAVHVLKLFYLRYDSGDSVEDALAYAMGHSGLPIVMSGATTAGGLLSFLATDLTPTRDFGMFAPIGVTMALVYCLVLLPALLAIVPLRRKSVDGSRPRVGVLDRLIVRCGDFSVSRPWPILGVTAVLVCVSLFGATRLQFSNDVMSWLPPSDPVRKAHELIDDKLEGSMTLEVVVDTGRENGVKDPAFLKALEELRIRTSRLRRGDYLFVGKTISVADIVKEIHRALNENRPEFYAVPQDARLVAQELLLFENTGSDDLEDVVDTAFSLARFTVKVPYVDPLRYDGFIDDVEAEFRDVFPDDVEIATTGFMGMMSQTLNLVMPSLAKSYGLALAIITPLMILLIGNLRGGLVSMVPNLTPILLTLGIMGWVGISIDMFTMMIGSIAIGLAVDDTIHFVHSYLRCFARSGDSRAAVRETLETTGRALLVTTVVLSSGFLIFALSDMRNLFYFGVLTSFTIAAAFVIDILVTPALLVLVTRPAGPS